MTEIFSSTPETNHASLQNKEVAKNRAQEKDLANEVFEKINSVDTLAKLPNDQIIKFVLDQPDKAADFLLKETGENEWKVDFGPIPWTLLGLGHLKFITKKFNEVSVNGSVGKLNINASPNKPGYSDQNGKYLLIDNGDTIKGITHEDFLQEDLITDFQNQSVVKNDNYMRELKKNPDFHKTGQLREFIKPIHITEKQIFGLKLNKDGKIIAQTSPEEINESQLSYKEADKLLRNDFTVVSSGKEFFDRNNKRATTIEGLQTRSVNGLLDLKSALGVDKKLFITGGTEIGHSRYKHGHFEGFKVDVRLDRSSKKIENFMKRQDSRPESTNVGPRYTFENNGYKYRIIKESDHLDIEIT